ncbi:aldehyde dehydrogenase family protein [Herbiconiux daphne]|uniref:Aldehyde dehydrogenase family protein n=1 Tax=Herbiconiux daphne TaxID=2970914 RepID=A0ABT2GX32_9MICO|nr:aldehyde dehydrogenase family protein [Herbiconiux daphne]MCS5732519.1 aldehyde dehydrogenase family protein [Herbiconiux daphne]
MREQGLYIGGGWVAAPENRPVADKWTGDIIGTVAVADAAASRAAVDAAARALAAGLPVPERSRALARVGELMGEHAEEFAQLITAETGKPITASRAEVGRAITTVQLSAEEAKRLPGETVPLDAVAGGADTLAFTIPIARGVVAAITPFNFPLNLLMHKVGPALAAGCPVLVKPSDHAPLTAGLLVSLFHEAGLAAGWINLVTGPPDVVVGAWQDDDRVAVITFTGSSKVGWALKAASPRKLHVLELGSNTAMVVADDADVARAARAATDAALGNSGQACVSLQRVYATRGVSERFVAALAALVADTQAGDPRLEGTVVGPLISAEARDRLVSWIDSAVASGARVAAGGSVVDGVLAPTVLVDVPRQSPLVCEEAFGPVVSVVVVDDVAEAIAEVNSADFGLNTSIYTADLAVAMRYARTAEAGSVLVNMPPSFRADHMPYGGVKGSGQGLEGVKYAVADLLQEKLVVLHA